MYRLLPLITLSFLLVASAAHAEEMDVWDFVAGTHLPDGSEGLTVVERGPDGLHIRTTTDGFLIWNTPFLHPVNVVSIRVRSAGEINAGVLWHSRKYPASEMQRDFVIPQSDVTRDMNISLDDWKDWDWKTDQMGIGFPANSDIVIEGVVWREYSLGEKLATMWKSFWTFDSFRVYSINFLWGPLLATNPVSLQGMYDHLPPVPWSITRIFYGAIFVAALIGAIFYAFDRRGGRRIFLLCVALTTAVCWVIFDIRMGLELMEYAHHDYKTYVDSSDTNKTFRTHGSFYTEAQKLLPALMKYPHYRLYTSEPSPFYANLRYMSYPSIPLRPEDKADDVHAYVVMDRPDIHIQNGQLIDGKGVVLSGSGKMTQSFTDGTFLFETL